MFLWCVRDGWRDIYSERGLLLPISSSRSQGVSTLAPPCKLVRDASAQLRVSRSTPIICTLSKSARMVLITWSPSGYTPVRLEYPDVPSSSRLQIKMWQLTKAHGVTRNEPKIHVICYIYNIAVPSAADSAEKNQVLCNTYFKCEGIRDCDILISNLELEWSNYVHVSTNTLGKDMNCSYQKPWVK